MTYDEQLKQPQWIEKREAIKRRDHYECQLCMSQNKLQVHHKKYDLTKMAWEYTDNYLITLCDRCHKRFHRIPTKRVTKINRTTEIVSGTCIYHPKRKSNPKGPCKRCGIPYKEHPPTNVALINKLSRLARRTY